MPLPRLALFHCFSSCVFTILNIASLCRSHGDLSSHSHPHDYINSDGSIDKKYYSNIMEIIKGSDLLSPTDSLRTLPHNYNDYDSSYKEIWGNDNEDSYDDDIGQSSSGSSPRFWKKFITHLIKDHMLEKQEKVEIIDKSDNFDNHHYPLENMNPDFMVAGLFAAMLGVFTTIAIVSHEARLANLESSQASICSATRTFGNLDLPLATASTAASINVAINAINNFAAPSC